MSEKRKEGEKQNRRRQREGKLMTPHILSPLCLGRTKECQVKIQCTRGGKREMKTEEEETKITKRETMTIKNEVVNSAKH